MIKKIVYPFGTALVYEKYLILMMNEGVNITPEYNDFLLRVATKYYVNKNFGYISIRSNSYSVDPMVYFEVSKIENLVAIAVVTDEESKIASTKFEKTFYKKSYQHFTTMESAAHWVNSIILKSTVNTN